MMTYLLRFFCYGLACVLLLYWEEFFNLVNFSIQCLFFMMVVPLRPLELLDLYISRGF